MRQINRKHSKGLFVAVAAALAATACAPAAVLEQGQGASVRQAVNQPQAVQVLPAGTVSGVIASHDGKAFVPVVGAIISVEGGARTATTDAEGRYTLGGLPSGTLTLKASKEGFSDSTIQVTMSPVAGVPRVNMALASNRRSLQGSAGTQTATITGVVSDPRGSALSGATVKVLSNAGAAGFNLPLITADANGMYTASLANIAVSALSPSQVQVTARGTSPGGVKLESTDVKALALTSTSLVVNAQCDAFTKPGTPTFPNGSYSPMDTVATLEATDMPSRVDEFYIELTSGTKKYGVLPNAVTITDATATTLQKGTVTFRIPFTLPDDTFTAKIVPFGQTTQATASSATFVTKYAQATFDADVNYLVDSAIVDATTTPPNPNNLNQSSFLGGETAQYRITLDNANTQVSQDMELSGTAPVGTTIGTVTVTPKVNGVAQAPITVAAGNITQPAAVDGKWVVKGISLPTAVGAVKGEAYVQINFVAPVNSPNGDLFDITGLAARMVSANLTQTVAPATPPTLTIASVDAAAFTITKAINTGTAAGDGMAQVVLTLTPVGSAALGRFILTDSTGTDTPPAIKATITGTETVPAQTNPPTPLGLNGLNLNPPAGYIQDKLVLKVDGVAETLLIAESTWGLETLIAFINTQLAGKVNASRTVDNKLKLERTQGGASKTLQIMTGANETTDNFLDKVMMANTGATALTAYKATLATPAAGSGASVIAEYTGADASASQPGTTWSFVTGGTSTHTLGAVTAQFTIDPPAAFGGTDSFATPITIKYRLRKDDGTAVNLGGGTGGTFGAVVSFFNLLTPFDDATKNQAMGNPPVGADPALQTGL